MKTHSDRDLGHKGDQDKTAVAHHIYKKINKTIYKM